MSIKNIKISHDQDGSHGHGQERRGRGGRGHGHVGGGAMGGDLGFREADRARGSRKSSAKMSPRTSPARKQEVTVKVKKLVSYQDGKLENLLLPVLVSATFLSKSGQQNASVDDRRQPGEAEQQYVRIKKEFREEATADGGYQEYEGSCSEAEGDDVVTLNDKTPASKRDSIATVPKPKPKTEGESEAFLSTLKHALDCKDCDDNACKKMRLVLGHFMSCKKFSRCTICEQLIAIVSEQQASVIRMCGNSEALKRHLTANHHKCCVV